MVAKGIGIATVREPGQHTAEKIDNGFCKLIMHANAMRPDLARGWSQYVSLSVHHLKIDRIANVRWYFSYFSD